MTNKIIAAVPALFALSVVALSGGPAPAQDAVLAELYGQGVHRYFAYDYADAYEFLTSAITQGSSDPRCYYYRGLSLLRLGRPEQAEQDFQKGAELEVSGRDRIYPVGRSLQRVQGSSRLLLEKYRRSARIAARIAQMKVEQARYEQQQRAEEQVLRDPSRTPASKPADLVGPPPTEDASDPFTQGEPEVTPAPPKPSAIDTAEVPPQPPASAASPAAAAAPTPATADPFETPAAPADDPFGASPAADPFAPAGTPPSDSDPFGAPAAQPPAAADPFGDPFAP